MLEPGSPNVTHPARRPVASPGVHGLPEDARAGQDVTVHLAVALSERLQWIIAETAAEFGRLTAYVRPTALRRFEAKTGQTIAEWQDTATNLTVLLEELRASEATAEAIFRTSYPCLKDWLNKLIAYYHEAPAEMARLAGEAGVLRDVIFCSPQRETSLRFLVDALERLAMRAQASPSTSDV